MKKIPFLEISLIFIIITSVMIFSVIPDSMSDVCDFNHISTIDIDSTTNIIFVAYNLGSYHVTSRWESTSNYTF
ncbi:MAG: hypothetical protein HRO68_01310 [Nitrosopumilus sp.]|nr:hypothetical protein [Nitrosopumilus sp.]